jgi:hypothetical protein
MAIVLELNYGKKLGLPGYSSHQYGLALKVELKDLSKVQAESRRLYELLQSCVDREIRKTGYLPEQGKSTRQGSGVIDGRKHSGTANGQVDYWACSPRQKNLILRIVNENRLDKKKIETLARERFGKSVRALNKPETSALISELVVETSRRNLKGR